MDKTIALYSKGLTEKTTAGLMKLIDALCDRGITIYLNIMDPEDIILTMIRGSSSLVT